MFSVPTKQLESCTHTIAHDSAFVYIESCPHAANISVAVMFFATNTAVQLLIADISPWILRSSRVSNVKVNAKRRQVRRIPSPEVSTSADNLVDARSVVHNDGAIRSEGAWAALFVEGLVRLWKLTWSVRCSSGNMSRELTSRMNLMRVSAVTPNCFRPIMF